MYFEYVTNWLYRLMNVPVPLVLSENIYGLVTVFDLFLFTVYLGVFIVLIKYLITDSLSFNVGGIDINYSSDAYVARRYRNSVNNHIKNSNAKKQAISRHNDLLKKQSRNMYVHTNDSRHFTYRNDYHGRFLAKKNSGRILVDKNANSIGHRILSKKNK